MRLGFQVELRRPLGHATHQRIGQSSSVVAQLVQKLVKFLLLLFDVYALSLRLSRMKETSMRVSAFIPFFLERALTPQERKRFGWVIKTSRIYNTIWMRKDDFMSCDLKTCQNNTIYMRKADFVSYRKPRENESRASRLSTSLF